MPEQQQPFTQPSSYRSYLDFAAPAGKGDRPPLRYQAITGDDADSHRSASLYFQAPNQPWEHGHTVSLPETMTDEHALALIRSFVLSEISHEQYREALVPAPAAVR